MNAEDVRARIRQHPFVPLRLYVSDGLHYDVLHHDFAIVSVRRVSVAVGAPTADDLPSKLVDIDPLHITRIETIDQKVTGGSPRRPRRKK